MDQKKVSNPESIKLIYYIYYYLSNIIIPLAMWLIWGSRFWNIYDLTQRDIFGVFETYIGVGWKGGGELVLTSSSCVGKRICILSTCNNWWDCLLSNLALTKLLPVQTVNKIGSYGSTSLYQYNKADFHKLFNYFTGGVPLLALRNLQLWG